MASCPMRGFLVFGFLVQKRSQKLSAFSSCLKKQEPPSRRVATGAVLPQAAFASRPIKRTGSVKRPCGVAWVCCRLCEAPSVGAVPRLVCRRAFGLRSGASQKCPGSWLRGCFRGCEASDRVFRERKTRPEDLRRLRLALWQAQRGGVRVECPSLFRTEQ